MLVVFRGEERGVDYCFMDLGRGIGWRRGFGYGIDKFGWEVVIGKCRYGDCISGRGGDSG